MNPLAIVKLVTELAVSIGAGAVVSNAIKVSTPANAHTVQKVLIGVGGFVLSGMVGEQAVKYATSNIDNGVAQWQDAKAKLESKPSNPPAEDTK